MATKDRLEELRNNYYDYHKTRPWLDDQTNDEDADCRVTIEPVPNETEEFLHKVENIDESFKEMTGLVDSMRKIHLTLLNKTDINEKTHRDLEDLNINFKIVSKRIKEDLKSIQVEIQHLEKEDRKKTAIYRIKQIQIGRLQKNVLDVMNEYNAAQSKYKDKCKEILKRQIQVTGRDINDEELDEMIENNASEVFIQNMRQESKLAKQQFEEIQSRHEDIIKIEKSIRELFEMFQDMATLVSEQGEAINRIENHVTNTYDYVEKAKEETAQALEYQRKARKLKIIAFIVLFIVLAIVIYSIFG